MSIDLNNKSSSNNNESFEKENNNLRKNNNRSIINIKNFDIINNKEEFINEEENIKNKSNLNNKPEIEMIQFSNYPETKKSDIKEKGDLNKETTSENELEKIKDIIITKSYSIYNFLFSSVLFVIFSGLALEICCFKFYSSFLEMIIYREINSCIKKENEHEKSLNIISFILNVKKKILLLKTLNLEFDNQSE